MAAESFEIKLIFAHGVALARASAKCHRLLSQHRRVGCVLPFEAECATVGRQAYSGRGQCAMPGKITKSCYNRFLWVLGSITVPGILPDSRSFGSIDITHHAYKS